MSERKHIHGVRPHWPRIWQDTRWLVACGLFVLLLGLVGGALLGDEPCLKVLAVIGGIGLVFALGSAIPEYPSTSVGREEWLIANGKD